MNYYLFVDNFRGFSDTCVPIADVSFLVGENSTGKSSLLGLAKLFSGHRFLMGQDFGDEDVGFSHFSDMVSANSEDQSYFRIGFVTETLVEKKGSPTEKRVSSILLTFREEQGQPRLFKCTFCYEKAMVTLKFGKHVFYKMTACTPSATSEAGVAALRSLCVSEHIGGENGYVKLDMPEGFGGPVPVLFALSLASSAENREKRNIVLGRWQMGFSPPDLTWFGPIRTKPRRTYDEWSTEFSPEGRHTPYLIRKMLKSRHQASRLKEFLEKVGKASGLFQEVRTKSFGKGAMARFELDIVLDDKPLNILDVGYGVSQALPIIVELLERERGTWFAIQEPEIHLHPRAQAALGDVLFEMAVTDRKRFIVETHSDYTIDRFRLNYRKARSYKPESQILFFERRDRHNVVTPLPIGNTGELPTDQPDSYRQFFVREQMNLLGI